MLVVFTAPAVYCAYPLRTLCGVAVFTPAVLV